MKRFLASLLVICSLLGAQSFASAATMHEQMHDGHTSGANQEYMKAMNDMHEPMMKGAMDSDPDTAFVRGMLWHHRGAVDMAKIQLKYGKDPELKKLAQDIIDAQDAEIKFMEEWLKKRDKTE